MAFSTHDQVPDSPTNTFATLNPLIGSLTGTMSDGNLKYSSGAVHDGLRSNIYVSTGKWYFETILISQVSGLLIGISSIDENVYESGNLGNYEYKNTIRYYSGNGRLYYHTGSTSTNVAYGDSWTNGDVIGVYLNLEDNELFFYKNGTAQNSGTAINLNSSTYNLGTLNFTARFDEGSNVNTTASVFAVNFGQDHLFGGATLPSGAGSNTPDNGIGTFAFSVPTDALALCTANLPDPSINPALDELPEDNFKAVTWTGDGSNPRDISIGFNPDFVWIKNRTGTANSHATFDSVRGFGKKHLWTDLTAGETANEFGHVSGVSNNNITVTAGTSDDTYVNNSGTTYVGWCFRAGGAPSGSTSTTGSAKRINTSGTQDDTSCSALATAASATITPTLMSINQKAGFSIVKYVSPNPAISNPSVPHGLDKAPDFVIIKRTSSACNWVVKHVGYNSNANNTLRLDTTDDIYVDAYNWGGNQVTNSVVPLGNYSNSDTNKPGETNIMYCWHSVAGYSAFGSYTGNGSADGPFVYTGFKPAWVMLKNTTTAATNWQLNDNVRDPNNVVKHRLAPSSSEAEQTNYDFGDFLSNGFKIRQTDQTWNKSGDVYIYAAFAEMPSKYAATNAR